MLRGLRAAQTTKNQCTGNAFGEGIIYPYFTELPIKPRDRVWEIFSQGRGKNVPMWIICFGKIPSSAPGMPGYNLIGVKLAAAERES